jgi:hypothetical protein
VADPLEQHALHKEPVGLRDDARPRSITTNDDINGAANNDINGTGNDDVSATTNVGTNDTTNSAATVTVGPNERACGVRGDETHTLFG